MLITRISRLLLAILFAYLFPWIYTGISQLWCEHGGASSSLNIFEFPYAVLVCLALYFNPLKSRHLFSRYIFFPPITIIGLYILYDLFYLYLKRSPRLSDFDNFFSLADVSIFLFATLLTYLLLLFIPTLYSLFKWQQELNFSRGRSIPSLILRLVVLCLVFLTPFSQQFYVFQQNYQKFDSWSETRNVTKNGRISSFFYYHNKRKETLQAILDKKGGAPYGHFYTGAPQSTPNIHIIVLESFIDPRLIQNLKFTRSPLSEKLAPFLLGGRSFSLITLPVYGGGSPQSEFEILTGLPAYAQIASTEFNVFEGTETSSFIRRLSQEGYYTMVAKGSKPGFYNSTNAYKGLGFHEIHYRDLSYYKKAKDDDYLFDGDLLSANLTYLTDHFYKADKNIPVVNYVVGMYGHLPFERNTQARPDVILTNSPDPLLTNLSNQFYYRTEALGNYLEKLREIDPDAIVFITSDHLPPIFHNGRKYIGDDYNKNIALLLNRFSPVDISGVELHRISHLLWLAMSSKSEIKKDNDSSHTSELLADIYLTVMREAMGI